MKNYIDFKTIDDSVYYSIIDTWYSGEELIEFNFAMYGDTYVLTVASYDDCETAPNLCVYDGKTVKELYEMSDCKNSVLDFLGDTDIVLTEIFSPVQLSVIFGGKYE